MMKKIRLKFKTFFFFGTMSIFLISILFKLVELTNNELFLKKKKVFSKHFVWSRIQVSKVEIILILNQTFKVSISEKKINCDCLQF